MKHLPKIILLAGLLFVGVLLGGAKYSEYRYSGTIERVGGCQYAVWQHNYGVTAVHAGNCDNSNGHARSNQ